jgi:hypothetical protein
LKRKAPDPREVARKQALKALAKAKRAADRAGVELSDWEDEFIGSVSERVKTYGRAFGDPEKGGAGSALSVLQAVKLKEIAAKVKARKARADADSEKPDDAEA